ncbi:TldD/PmbA family protein [Alkaliphilus peptidifermentans]|uniref:PmbA protein n=1 Tax=Alkaliphilus peptidifermentans DSM 18978 TaxID=1120976 RepID=A0A1G5AXU4_9FIRM|nr:TldD/PmbA family protein [Alkaliphilus peptidifermentans]SCX82693.1 PmbA protein [Alkaliphilus peptidifermentans DSM 18978]
MNKSQLINRIFDKSKIQGINEVEVYLKETSSLSFNIYKGKLEKYIIGEEINISLRGIYNGKMGYSYTEKVTEDSIEELLSNLKGYALSNTNDSQEYISAQLTKQIDCPQIKSQLEVTSSKGKMDFMLKLEKKASSYDERIKEISYCNYTESKQNIFIKNSKGLELQDSHNIGTIDLGVIVKDGKGMQTGYTHHVINNFSEEYMDNLINESVGDALAMIGATSIGKGKYKVILRNNVAADIMSSFSSIFFSSTVQKSLSKLKEKLGLEVAVKMVNIVEDPLLEEGKTFRRFDDEGTPTTKKYLIEQGKLKTYLYNNKTAKKDNVTSTGNGFKNSHKATIGVEATNMYIEKGDLTLVDLTKEMKDGIIITGVDGLHAGINAISGNFSLSANGLLVENGQIVRSLAQITVSGNLYTMLLEILAIGQDIKFSHPSSNYFGAPSILVKELTISGNE